MYNRLCEHLDMSTLVSTDDPAGQRLQQQIERLEILFEAQSGNVRIAQQLASLAVGAGEWRRVVETLGAFQTDGPAVVLRSLGIALCKVYGDAPSSDGFRQGQSLLEQALEKAPRDVDARSSLAGSWRKRAEASEDARERADCHRTAQRLYREAHEIDPSDPYPLGNCLEYELIENPAADLGVIYQMSTSHRVCAPRWRRRVGGPIPMCRHSTTASLTSASF